MLRLTRFHGALIKKGLLMASDTRTFHIGPASDREQGSSQLIPSKHSSSPFPFHRLPSELLIAIFEEGLRSSLPRFSEHNIPFPIIVSHVCRLWRDTALDCATLWTDIVIDDNRMADTYQISRMYLARSKSTLIDVRCHWHTFSCKDPPVKETITDILPHIGRVRHLSMIQQSETVFLAVMGIFRDVAAPCLESLLISLPYQEQPGDTLPFANDSLPLFTRGAPLLRSIWFNEVPYIVQPQFTRLTSFSLRVETGSKKITLRDFLDFLSNSSQTLINLTVWEVCLEPSLAVHNLSPFELPQLQHLRLYEVDFFPHIYTPHLQSLSLHTSLYLPATMEIFSKRCSSLELSKLQFLRFDGLDLSLFKSQTAVAHGLPFLTELVFWECGNERAFLSLLEDYSIPDQSKGEIMPRLHSLTVSDELCWPWLRAILANRIARGIPIKFVRFPESVQGIENIGNWLTARSIGWDLYDLERERFLDQDEGQWEGDFFDKYEPEYAYSE